NDLREQLFNHRHEDEIYTLSYLNINCKIKSLTKQLEDLNILFSKKYIYFRNLKVTLSAA
ncbi:hypothetical protein Q8G40_30355, partial [Klebsiella pneumoniae]|uniref:hypothetical protein n=1 Tax=Klebsiella pneumoniae TaxID=573 RepID=UPI0030133EA0